MPPVKKRKSIDIPYVTMHSKRVVEIIEGERVIIYEQYDTWYLSAGEKHATEKPGTQSAP